MLHSIKLLFLGFFFFSRTYGPTAVWKEQVFYCDHVAGTILEQKILIKAQVVEINIGD